MRRNIFLFLCSGVLMSYAHAQSNQCKESLVRDASLFGLTNPQAEKIAPLIMGGRLKSSDVEAFQKGLTTGDNQMFNTLNSFKLGEAVDELGLSFKPNLLQRTARQVQKYIGFDATINKASIITPGRELPGSIRITRLDGGYSVQSKNHTLIFKLENGSCYLETSLTPTELSSNVYGDGGKMQSMLNVKGDQKICSVLRTYFNTHPKDEICSTPNQCKELNETVSQIDARIEAIENEVPVKGTGLKTVYANIYRKNRVQLNNASVLRGAYNESCDNFIHNNVRGSSSSNPAVNPSSTSGGVR
ncbi:MAG: hypothetical protein IPK04_11885 [Bdellovibrionales bacterium]|nr:hypothetical protein [Bdellovibrionales bacterium]